MSTSNFYQEMAAKLGLISNPIDLAAKLEKIKSTLAGETPPVPEDYLNNEQYNRALREYAAVKQLQPAIQPPKKTIEYKQVDPAQKAATKAFRSGMSDQVNNYQYEPDMQDVAEKNKKYNLESGAPVYQKGTSVVTGPDGQVYDLPTSVAQAMAYEQGVNLNRVDVKQKYLGAPLPDGNTYSDAGVRTDYLRKVGQNPLFQGGGALNDFLGKEQQVKIISTQFDVPRGQVQPNLNYATERLNVAGEGQRGRTGNQIINDEIAALPNATTNKRLAMYRYGQQSAQVQDVLNNLQEMRPTTSNLQIKETVKK